MRRKPVTGATGAEADGNLQTSARVDASSWTVVVCTRAGLTISGTELGRSFAPGDELDLDAPAAPNCSWRAAIGDHLTEFFIPRDGEGA